LKEGLNLLYALQRKDDHLKEIEAAINEIPNSIKELEVARDLKSGIVSQAKASLSQNLEERKKFEKEIQLIREKIAKYKEQMIKVTTNKEYQGFINEIKFEENNILGVEEKIIEKMVENDEILETIRRTENEYNIIAGDYNQKIKDLSHSFEYLKSNLAEETLLRDELQKKIPGSLIKVYEQLYRKKESKAVSLVETEFCGICNVLIRPQLLNELIISNEILVCENCGRILYKQLREEPDVPIID
jgi:uncharacterized protein